MINSIELFTGTGGLATGMQLAGCNHKAVIEWDNDSCENLRANIRSGYEPMRHWDVIQSDVRLLDYGRFGSSIQLISGGPPCQPFSLGGKHKAHDDQRDMFPEAVRAVRELRPKAFVFENVKGLLRKSFSTYFNYIILQLTYPDSAKKPGEDWEDHLARLERQHTGGRYVGVKYNVVYRLLNAADYGVPQTRQRVVIVGFRDDLGLAWSFAGGEYSRESLLYAQHVTGTYWEEHQIAKKHRPQPSLADARKVERLKAQYLYTNMPTKRWRTVRDVIGDLPDPLNEKGRRPLNHEFRAGARSYPGHTGSVLDEPSKTIKAGVHGVPGGENTIVLDDGSLRYYTVRESARIQTFPDNYQFFGSWTESMRQIGNAVPVELARAIGASIINRLEREVNQIDQKRYPKTRAI